MEERELAMVDREKMRDTSITGNLTDAPRLREGPNGSFVTMRVVENQREYDREQQQWVDGSSVGYDVAIGNERLAKHSLNNLSKGDRVTVRGDVQVSPYVHKETGEPGLNRRMHARDVQVSMFDDRFDPTMDTVREAERSQEREVSTQSQERAPLDGPGTPPPPGPPQQVASVDFGQPTPEQQREVAQRQHRAEQSWAAVAQQHQQHHQPGLASPSM